MSTLCDREDRIRRTIPVRRRRGATHTEILIRLWVTNMNRSGVFRNHGRILLAAALMLVGSVLCAQPAPATTAASTPAAQFASLAGIYKHDFLIGVAIDFNQDMNPVSREEQEIITRHFNCITPENSMKPQS